MSNKHLLILVSIILLGSAFGFGQSSTRGDSLEFTPSSNPFFGGPVYGDAKGSPHIGLFPAMRIPQEFVTAYFLNRMLFQGGDAYVERPYAHSGPRGYFWRAYDPGYYTGYWGRAPRHYSGAYFVSEWIDRDPVGASQGTGLEESILLREGMSQEDVMGILGSPNQRVRLKQREVWKYSAFSLLFEAGVLVELR